jgi:hypothetical protein
MLLGLLPSHGTGGPEARLQSASRILVEAAHRSVATSLSQFTRECRRMAKPYPGDPPFLGANGAEPPRRLTLRFGSTGRASVAVTPGAAVHALLGVIS